MILHGACYPSWGKLDSICSKATLLKYLRKIFSLLKQYTHQKCYAYFQNYSRGLEDSLKHLS